MFPRDSIDSLPFSYLCPAAFLLLNHSIEKPNTIWSAQFNKQIRNAVALSLYPQIKQILIDAIDEAFNNFEIDLSTTPGYIFANILHLLSVASLSENDSVAQRIFAKIDSSLVLGDVRRAWIVQHLGHSDFLMRHLRKAKWNLPVVASIPKLRMLIHLYQDSFLYGSFSDEEIKYQPAGHVDIYKIDPSHIYNCVNEYFEPCVKKANAAEVISEKPLIIYVFPARTKVTPLMINLLTKWTLKNDITMEESLLVRLIILVDQITIITNHI